MSNQKLVVGLDIGTRNVKATIADISSNDIRIIGVSSVKTQGLDKGNIVDINQTAEAIKQVLSNVEEKAGTHNVKQVVTAIPANMLQLKVIETEYQIDQEAREIDNQDVERALNQAFQLHLETDRAVVSFTPLYFKVNGLGNVGDPRRMMGQVLTVKGTMMTAPKYLMHNLKKAIETAGYQSQSFVAAPLAFSSVALTDDEKEFGTILLDIGGGQTTASVIQHNQLRYAFVDLEAGSDITNDIAVVLNTSKNSAEQIKIDFGNAMESQTRPEDTFSVEKIGQKNLDIVDERYLSQIISARVDQILDNVGSALYRNDLLEAPGGIVISGGSAELAGLEEFVQNFYGIQTRIYSPDQMGMRHPEYTNVYGIIHYMSQIKDIDRLINHLISVNIDNKGVSANSDKRNNNLFSKFNKPNSSSNSNDEQEQVNNNSDQSSENNSSSKQQNSNKKQPKQGKQRLKNFWSKFFD
ncbi:cell division protein FtsA [Holzapfeliella sp. JNUCC 80]